MSRQHQIKSANHQLVQSPNKQRVVLASCPDADATRLDATDMTIHCVFDGSWTYTFTGGEITGSYTGDYGSGPIRMPERQVSPTAINWYFRRGNRYHLKFESSGSVGTGIGGVNTWRIYQGYEAFGAFAYAGTVYTTTTTTTLPNGTTTVLNLPDYLTAFPELVRPSITRCTGVYFWLDWPSAPYYPSDSADYTVRIRIYRDGTTPNF